MRAAVYHGREDVRLESVPEPQAGPGEVKLTGVAHDGIERLPRHGGMKILLDVAGQA